MVVLEINPLLDSKYVTFLPKGVPMFYVRLGNALYRALRAAMLFYNRLRSNLKGMAFEVNPYDLGVANKMLNGKQMTVC